MVSRAVLAGRALDTIERELPAAMPYAEKLKLMDDIVVIMSLMMTADIHKTIGGIVNGNDREERQS